VTTPEQDPRPDPPGAVDVAPVSVTLAALTFRRPQDLALLLPELVAQARRQGPGWDVGVLVVDNDPDRGAQDAVLACAAASTVPVRYTHEPEPSIAAARNRALNEAGTRLLVFIDDDERPSPDWLSLLLAEFGRSRAAAVVGPVVSTFQVEPDAWIEAGGFFRRRRMPSGSRVALAATNNLLLDLDVVRRHGLQFDRAYALTGGEDMLFSRQLDARGEQIVWCDEAVVTDVVPAARVTHRFVTMRAFSHGNSWARTSLSMADRWPGRPLVRARLLGRGGSRVLAGGLRVLLGRVARRTDHDARGTRTMMRGVGMVGGAVGWRYEEYRRP